MKHTIDSLLQNGPNPKQNGSRAGYHQLKILEIDNNRWELIVNEMRGEEVYHQHHKQLIGDQLFVQTVRDLGTKYRIHKENYEYFTS